MLIKPITVLTTNARSFSTLVVRLVPIRRVNMKPHAWADDFDLRLYRHSIETRNSQLEAMGIQTLHARTNAGFEIKVIASLLALACLNLN
jgi:hypothetical protein